MNKKYGIAIIGAGYRGKAYSKACLKSKQVELNNICDIVRERAEKVKNKYNFKAVYEDYKKAIDSKNIDIVIVAVPAALHPQISNFAMEKGKHVLSEKPMALSMTAAEDMIRKADDNRVKLALGFQRRFMEEFRKYKKIMEEDLFKTPLLVSFNDIRSIRTVVSKPKMHDAVEGNGGPMVDMICHITDLTRWYIQSEPIRVTAKNFTFAENRPELDSVENLAPDTGAILIEFEDSSILNVNISWGLPPQENTEDRGNFDIMGVNGLIDNKLEQVSLSPQEQKEVEFPELGVLNNLIEGIKGKKEIMTGGEAGLIALATSLAAVKSSVQGRKVDLKEIYEEKPALKDLI